MFDLFKFFLIKISIIVLFVSCSNEDKIKQLEIVETNKNPNLKSCCDKINKIDFINKHGQLNLKLNDSLNLKTSQVTVTNKMLLIRGGEFMMGANNDQWALGREFPKHKVKVNSFLMDMHEVTNREFMEFVNATGYRTVAEQKIDWKIIKNQLPTGSPKPHDSLLAAGSLVFFQPKNILNTIDFSQWWKWVKGANWKNPFGSGGGIKGLENHPVVHISYQDAVEYARWCKKRLPTEAEWEWAARGGLENCIYPWGNEHIETGKAKCNFWEGNFPVNNTKEDGFLFTSPVMNYQPNGFGLYDMAGNVWEICSDWYNESYYKLLSVNEISLNPKGPKTWKYSREPYDPKKVIRGGSFLCNDSYCASYRVSARMPFSMDTGTNHTGFRCVKDI